ncbi:hypothetical protein [Clostridium thailandense]|uniref:hypothetical protein n=1 Tax=Clostridium thailandense TaxID=2794346 RepID=UPI003989C165
MKHSRSVASFFSLLPGAGHMYLGLTRQGIQLMLLFFSDLFISTSFSLEFLGVFLPIIWFYSIFDVRTKSLYEGTLPNNNLPIFSDIDSIDDIFKNKPAEKYIAYILILMGFLSLLNNIVIPILGRYYDYQILLYAKHFIISLILIAIGVILLKGKKITIRRGDELCKRDE